MAEAWDAAVASVETRLTAMQERAERVKASLARANADAAALLAKLGDSIVGGAARGAHSLARGAECVAQTVADSADSFKNGLAKGAEALAEDFCLPSVSGPLKEALASPVKPLHKETAEVETVQDENVENDRRLSLADIVAKRARDRNAARGSEEVVHNVMGSRETPKMAPVSVVAVEGTVYGNYEDVLGQLRLRNKPDASCFLPCSFQLPAWPLPLAAKIAPSSGGLVPFVCRVPAEERTASAVRRHGVGLPVAVGMQLVVTRPEALAVVLRLSVLHVVHPRGISMEAVRLLRSGQGASFPKQIVDGSCRSVVLGGPDAFRLRLGRREGVLLPRAVEAPSKSFLHVRLQIPI
eukprot:scaffold298_cov247-Pinguiococcus_pyrenoidosus.AAC.4